MRWPGPSALCARGRIRDALPDGAVGTAEEASGVGIELITPVVLFIVGLTFAIATGLWSAHEEHEREQDVGRVA